MYRIIESDYQIDNLNIFKPNNVFDIPNNGLKYSIIKQDDIISFKPNHKYTYQIILNDDNFIFSAKNKFDLCTFRNTLNISTQVNFVPETPIDWSVVSEKYQGLELILNNDPDRYPNINIIDKENKWHLSWNNYTGYVWDTRCIKSLKKINDHLEFVNEDVKYSILEISKLDQIILDTKTHDNNFMNRVNKSLLFWLMDFAIDGKSKLSGNYAQTTFVNIKCLFNYIENTYLLKQFRQNYPFKKATQKFMDIIDFLMTDSYNDIISNIDELTNFLNVFGVLFIPSGWTRHLTSCGFTHDAINNTYSVIYINAGKGLEYHSPYVGNPEYDNAIMIFNDIIPETMIEFLKRFNEFNKMETDIGDFFYVYVLGLLNNQPNATRVIPSAKLSLKSQVSGTCSFTNIYYIWYYLCTYYNDNNNITILEAEDQKFKNILAKQMYFEILEKAVDLYKNDSSGSKYETNNVTENIWTSIVHFIGTIYKIDTTNYQKLCLENSNIFSDRNILGKELKYGKINFTKETDVNSFDINVATDELVTALNDYYYNDNEQSFIFSSKSINGIIFEVMPKYYSPFSVSVYQRYVLLRRIMDVLAIFILDAENEPDSIKQNTKIMKLLRLYNGNDDDEDNQDKFFISKVLLSSDDESKFNPFTNIFMPIIIYFKMITMHQINEETNIIDILREKIYDFEDKQSKAFISFTNKLTAAQTIITQTDYKLTRLIMNLLDSNKYNLLIDHDYLTSDIEQVLTGEYQDIRFEDDNYNENDWDDLSERNETPSTKQSDNNWVEQNEIPSTEQLINKEIDNENSDDDLDVFNNWAERNVTPSPKQKQLINKEQVKNIKMHVLDIHEYNDYYGDLFHKYLFNTLSVPTDDKYEIHPERYQTCLGIHFFNCNIKSDALMQNDESMRIKRFTLQKITTGNDSYESLMPILVEKINDSDIQLNVIHHSYLLLFLLYFAKIYPSELLLSTIKKYLPTHELIIELFENIMSNTTINDFFLNISEKHNNINSKGIVGLMMLVSLQYGIILEKITINLDNLLSNKISSEPKIIVNRINYSDYLYNNKTYTYFVGDGVINNNCSGNDICMNLAWLDRSKNEKSIPRPILEKQLSLLCSDDEAESIKNHLTKFNNLSMFYEVEHEHQLDIIKVIQENDLDHQNILSIIKYLLCFETSSNLALYKTNTGYLLKMLTFGIDFQLTVSTKQHIGLNDSIIIIYSGKTYTVLPITPYNRGVYNCFNVKENGTSQKYLMCLSLDNWADTNNNIKGIFNMPKKYNLPDHKNSRYSNVHLIKINELVFGDNLLGYSELLISQETLMTQYLISCFYYNNYYYFLTNFRYVNNLWINYKPYHGNLDLLKLIDNPFGLLVQKLFTSYKIIEVNSQQKLSGYNNFPGILESIYTNGNKSQINFKIITKYSDILDITKPFSIKYEPMISPLYTCITGRQKLFEYLSNITVSKDEYYYYNDSLLKNYSLKFAELENHPDYQKINWNKYLLSDHQRKLLNMFMTTSGVAREKNVEIAYQFYKYLKDSNKKSLYPIQELIMGGGKSRFIVPMTIIMLLAELDKKHVIVCVPQTLVTQTFEILYNYVAPLVERRLLYLNSNYNDEWLGTDHNNTFNWINDFSEKNGSIILVNDITFKTLCLKSRIPENTKYNDFKSIILDKSYILFDEIDLLANPLTCELNFQYGLKTKMDEYNHIIDLAKVYYELLNPGSKLWNQLVNSELVEYGFEYNLIIQYNDNIKSVIDSFIDKNIPNELKTNKYLIQHINTFVVPFVLTNKYNLNYGIPDIYPNDITDKAYKFKVIPYSALNTPSYGSEFSDPIMNVFLTYFYYKYNNIRRDVDKIELINFIRRYVTNGTFGEKEMLLFNHFKTYFEGIDLSIKQLLSKEISLEKYLKDYHFVAFKEGVDEYFTLEFYFKNIINNYLNSYFGQMYNISMTELLLSDNFTNYVAFTGTSYVHLPKNEPGKLNFGTEINKDLIQTNKYGNIGTSVAICYAINKMKNIHHYYDDKITDIFDILSKYPYNTLIDAGAFFIKHTIKKLILELSQVLKSKFKYIVFADVYSEFYDIQNDLFKSLDQLEENIDKKLLFFIFDNAHITGLDFRKYMPLDSIGLTTLSFNTRLRDVSQGIFRLRDIFDHQGQYTDFIVDKKLDYIIKEAICDSTFNKNNLKCVNDISETDRDEIQKKLYIWLCQNEYNYNRQQSKIMLKQNILGLYRNAVIVSEIDVNLVYNFEYPKSKFIENLDDKNLEIASSVPSALIKELLNNYKMIKINTINPIIAQNQKQDIKSETKANDKIKQELKRMTIYRSNTFLSVYLLNYRTVSSAGYRIPFNSQIVAALSDNIQRNASIRYIYLFPNNNTLISIIINDLEEAELFQTLFENKNTGAIITINGELIIDSPIGFYQSVKNTMIGEILVEYEKMGSVFKFDKKNL